jgi:AcrR family transcriptional regulator
MVEPGRTAPEAVRREQLLAAARTVFRERGYEGARIADIVRAAGLAQGTFYLYFSSKREVLLALIAEIQELMLRAVLDAYDPSHPVEQRFQAMTRAGFRCAREAPDLVALLNFAPAGLAQEVQSTYFHQHPLLSSLTDVVRAGIAAGELEPMDAEIAMDLIFGMYHHAFRQVAVVGDPAYAERLESGITQLVVNALRRRS